MIERILERLRGVPGDVSFYYRPMGGEAVAYQADLPLVAASVIKLPIMIEVFRQGREPR